MSKPTDDELEREWHRARAEAGGAEHGEAAAVRDTLAWVLDHPHNKGPVPIGEPERVLGLAPRSMPVRR